MKDYNTYIHKSRYARWLEEEKRRETWEETVDRYINFMYHQIKNNSAVSTEELGNLYVMLGATCER